MNQTNHLSTEILLEISKQYGDAFYLLNSEQFRENYTELFKAFQTIYPHFNIAYSYKTNYTPRLCRIVNDLGGYGEVVSEMELEAALRVGVPPQKIIWNGPIKNAGKTEELLLAGGTVNLDSIFEWNTVKETALKYPDRLLHIGIRCNYDIGDGTVSRFGFDVESQDFSRILTLIKESNNVRLISLQSHFANRSAVYWPARAEGMIKAVHLAKEILGYVPERIDLGGGIYGKMPEELKRQFASAIPDYKTYAQAAAKPFARAFPDAAPELLIEPGSALAGDSMKFVCRVGSIKTVRGKTFATVLGSQKNVSMDGVTPPLEVYPTDGEKRRYTNLDIVGYTCIEADVLYRGFAGRLGIGDYLVFGNCGSYSLVMKPPFILPNFPVLDICDGTITLIKTGECFDDLFHTFVF